MMQFISNSDFPASHLPTSQWAEVAMPPDRFDPADVISCTRITTRVICRYDALAMAIAHRNRDTAGVGDEHRVLISGVDYVVKTAVGVLVYFAAIPNDTAEGGGGLSDSTRRDVPHTRVRPSSSSSRHFSPSLIEQAVGVMGDDDVPAARHGAAPSQPRVPNASSTRPGVERAYWLRRTLRTAIYGNVVYGTVLRKLNPPMAITLPNSTNRVTVEWEETHECVAVKEMSWEHIRSQTHRSKLVEDPIREVSAMQYFSKWHMRERQRHMMERQRQIPIQIMHRMGFSSAAASGYVSNFDTNSLDATLDTIGGGVGGYNTGVPVSSLRNVGQWMGQQRAMLPAHTSAIQNMAVRRNSQDMLCSHIVMQLDLLSDDRYLYSVMPYCDGGEMFDVIEKKRRLTEPEARYCMRQLLRALRCLKNAGVCHRDLSLENLLVCNGKILVIDMGMCLRIPVDNVSRRRCLILPQDVCGKWHYMSPEVCTNELPFDGPAVDLWAAGVILFLMLTGFPPWERPVLTDDRFKLMSSGYLVQILTEWRLGLSGDAMDLLQRMFWLDPTDRLSLDQVCLHPWMSSGLPEYPTV